MKVKAERMCRAKVMKKTHRKEKARAKIRINGRLFEPSKDYMFLKIKVIF